MMSHQKLSTVNQQWHLGKLDFSFFLKHCANIVFHTAMGERLDISRAWRSARLLPQSECILLGVWLSCRKKFTLCRLTRRAALAESGVHVLRQAGIHGDAELGAFSICMSKGYEDNVDRGNTMYVRLLLGHPIYWCDFDFVQYICWLWLVITL